MRRGLLSKSLLSRRGAGRSLCIGRLFEASVGVTMEADVELDVIGVGDVSHCTAIVAALEQSRKTGNTALPERVRSFASAEEWVRQSRREHWAARIGKGGIKGFDAQTFFERLPLGCRHGAGLLYAHCLSSTQTLVYESALLPPGTVCVADVQTNGKGRGSNTWVSPPGCLLFTVCSSVTQARTLPLVQYLACLAIVQGVKSLDGMGQVDLGIKWPNDIYANRKDKIGGILCQSVICGQDLRVCVGVGLNVNNALPTTCLNALGTSAVGLEQVLAAILGRLDALLEQFEHEGFEKRIKSQYEAAWLHSGQRVVVSASDGAEPQEAVIQGLSVASGGALLAKATKTGETLELFPDGNRLDFFQGLISKKLA